MDSGVASGRDWVKRGAFFLLFFLLGTAVFAIITLAPYVPGDTLLKLHVAVTAVLLVVALILRASQRGWRFWPVCYAFSVAGGATLLSGLYADEFLVLSGLTTTVPQAFAVAKLSESVLRVVPILALMPVAGFSWRSLYLKTGRVGIWLPVGIAAFFVFPTLAYLVVRDQPGMPDKMLPQMPWILIFIFANAFMEELLFRGLFLQRYEPFLGRGGSVVLTAVVFTLMHTQVTYTPEMVQFLLVTLILSLVWGYLIQRTDSLWGAVLFHAAVDCLIIIPAFASI